VTDDAGHSIHLNQAASRIISLAPDLTETLFIIGAGKQIAGTIQGSDYPPAAAKIPQTGSYSGLDLEKIMALHPDLVVTWGDSFSRQLTVLKKFGIPIYKSDPRKLEDISRTMNNLGCLTGKNDTARQQSGNFSRRLAALRAQFHLTPLVTVFYQIGAYSLITVNKNSWISQAIALCGGRNVFDSAVSIAPEVSFESVVTANPEVIISDASSQEWQKRWLKWREIRAVQHGFLFAVDADLIERPGPRLLDGVAQICTSLKSVSQ
jgi:iron complex transport system substrate-binding protein